MESSAKGWGTAAARARRSRSPTARTPARGFAARASEIRAKKKRAAPDRVYLLRHFNDQPRRYACEELMVDAELSQDAKRMILNAYYALPHMTYYELLNVAPGCDKAAVRDAYFELSRCFHPDSVFGKKLGPFQRKMEKVFTSLTIAHDVLRNPAKRRVYDQCLEYQRDMARIERGPSPRGRR